MDDDIEFRIVNSTPKVSTVVVDVPMEEPVAVIINSDDDDISLADEEELLAVDDLSDLSGDEFLDDDIYANLPMTLEEHEIETENIDIYQDLPSSLPSIDELSDLSDSEQFMDEEPEHSGMSAELMPIHFAAAISAI